MGKVYLDTYGARWLAFDKSILRKTPTPHMGSISVSVIYTFFNRLP